MSNSIYADMVEAGVETANHESDLYVPVCPESDAIIREYEFKNQVTVFYSNIDGLQWYDIPFAFDPYWSARGMG